MSSRYRGKSFNDDLLTDKHHPSLMNPSSTSYVKPTSNKVVIRISIEVRPFRLACSAPRVSSKHLKPRPAGHRFTKCKPSINTSISKGRWLRHQESPIRSIEA